MKRRWCNLDMTQDGAWGAIVWAPSRPSIMLLCSNVWLIRLHGMLWYKWCSWLASYWDLDCCVGELFMRDLLIQTMYSSGMPLFLTVTAAIEDDTDGIGINCCPLEAEWLYEWNGDEAALT